MKKIILGLTVAASLVSVNVSAKTLNVGVAVGATTMDPHFFNQDATNSILGNMFDNLISFDKDLKTQANLAESWSNPEPTVWIIKLRKNVKFHNGSDFNADDVLFTYDRARNWEKSAFKSKINMIKNIEKVDSHTIKMTTNKPYPIFLRQLTYISILDKETLSGKTDQWIGLNPVGTGPYKLKSWAKGSSIKMQTSGNYWKGDANYSDLVFKPLTNDATRVAGILSGAVDIIDKVPAVDVNKIKQNSKLNFFLEPGLRTLYLHMDQNREISPYAKGKDGKNPLLNKDVRHALSIAINRESITKFIMKGFAVPASQLSSSAINGHDTNIADIKYDMKKAKNLLKKAGYENGFELQLDTLNKGIYPKVAQAVASSLSRIGIKIKVNATPGSTFFSTMGKYKSSFSLIGWASGSGDASSFIDSIVHSVDASKGYGKYNWGRFANAKVDALVEASASTMDPNKRLEQLKEIQRIALLDEYGYIPIQFEVSLYASSKKVSFEPRTNGYIWAFDVN